MKDDHWDEKPWFVPGKWCVGIRNWADEVRRQMPNLPKKIEIIDVTLREADDQMGLYLTLEDKVKLALMSSAVGARELDIGGPSSKPHQAEVCRAVRKAFDKAGIDRSITRISGRYFGIAKDHKHEIDVIMGAGATDIRCTVNSPTVAGAKAFEEQVARIPEAVDYTHNKYGTAFTVSMDETVRAPMEYIHRVYKIFVDAGVDKAKFTDTNGVSIPSATRYLAMEIKKIIGDMPLGCHIHNHSGLGVANTLAAIEGGVTEPDCTWNGYGDQAGLNCLAEVVCDLEALYGVKTGFKLEKLTEVSEMVEKMCGVEVQKHKAFTGKDAFAFMINSLSSPIGLVLGGAAKEEVEKIIADRDKQGGEPYVAAAFGRKKDYCWGSYGSRRERLVKGKLDVMGLKYTDQDIKKILQALVAEVDKQVTLNKELMAKKQRGYLTDEEFEKLVREIIPA
jgi:2-isopropylmalate synthase